MFLTETAFVDTVLFPTRTSLCDDVKLNMAPLGYGPPLSLDSRRLFALLSILSLLLQLFCVLLSLAPSASLKLSREPTASLKPFILRLPLCSFQLLSGPTLADERVCVCMCAYAPACVHVCTRKTISSSLVLSFISFLTLLLNIFSFS